MPAWKDPILRLLEQTHETPAPNHAPELGACWTWTRPLSQGCKGYPRMHYKGRALQSYTVSYLEFIGPVPDGLQLDHLCRNRLCCNPLHLEPVTQQENLRRARWANASIDVCVKGHPRDETNNPYPKYCLYCARENTRRMNAKLPYRSCPVCGNEFQPSSPKVRSCSHACGQALRFVRVAA